MKVTEYKRNNGYFSIINNFNGIVICLGYVGTFMGKVVPLKTRTRS